MITYDHSKLLSESLGSRSAGLTRTQLSNLLAKGEDYIQALKNELQARPPGFLALPGMRKELKGIADFAQRRAGTYDALLLLGIGGSVLGAQAIDEALRPIEQKPRHPELRVIDNTDPATLARGINGLEPNRTQVLVVSKSGATLETLASLAVVEEWLTKAGLDLSRHLTVVTGQSGFLADYAAKHGLTRFEIPEGVPGRFSVLSPAGLLPATLLKYDTDKLLAGAAKMSKAVLGTNGGNDPLLAAAAHVYLGRTCGRPIHVFMPYHSRLKRLGQWFAQLWAESLGKARDRSGATVHAGFTAVAATGATDQHSQLQLYLDGPADKVVTLVEVEDHRRHIPLPDGFDYDSAGLGHLRGRGFGEIIAAQLDATQSALTERGCPNARLTVPCLDEEHLGALFAFLQMQTACAAMYMNVNAYDQPAVERIKQLTCERLGG